MLARITAKASILLLLIVFSFAAKAQLHANFNANPITQCAPGVVQFTDSSTGNITQWKWDLGNGTTSFLKNPSATYLNPGIYTIKLVIKNSTQSDSIVKDKYITIYALPTAQFTSTATTGCYPLKVQFTDQSIAGSGSTVATREWDFGDGFTSADQNPVHIYNNSGNFNVTLRVTNNNGCTKTVSKTQYIQISSGVHAGFTNNSLTTCKPPVTINFNNTSNGTGILSYQWSFGDGSSSNTTSPSHSYTLSGTYTIQLITTNSVGCTDTLTKLSGISIGNVNASFSSSADSVCLGNSIVFKNTSTPAASSVLWDFGDGTSSSSANPSKSYSANGNYQVKLTANFGACTDSFNKNVVVLPKPTAAFIGDDTAFCKIPATVNFTSQSTNISGYQWSFGDGSTSTSQNPSHTYNSVGNYDVTLAVTNASGCTDTLKKKAYIKIQLPKVSFTNLADSGCAPFTKTFKCAVNSADSVVSYAWDFGDGDTSSAVSPTHTFNLTGSYTIKLMITTAGGCTSSATIVNGIIVTTIPTAAFSVTPRDACAKTLISFTDLSTGNATHWLWSFGDGTNSTIQNPSHIYNDTGYFDIQLIAWNRGCPDTLQYPKYVHINPPIAKFLVTNICSKPYDRSFTDQSIGADEWNWDFGDGTTSNIPSPLHTYADTGTYVVTLLVRNYTSGCDFTTSKTIKLVIAKANFYATDSVICRGKMVTLTAAVGNTANVTSYSWGFGDGTGTTSNLSYITHNYTKTGYYDVGLVITDILGCKDTMVKKQYIRVDGPIAKFSSGVSGACLKSAIAFNDSSVSDGLHPIQTWIWNYGDGKTDTLTAPPFQHLYTAAGIYSVSLKVIDSKGCADSFKLPTTLIISSPLAGFVASDTLTCPNKLVNFTNQSVGSTIASVWDFGDGNISDSTSPGHTFTTDGVYDIKLLATDKYGCMDSLIKKAYITIKSPVADFSMSDSVSTCPPLLVHFTNLSQNIDSLQWDFGDSTTSALSNPSHFYTYPGTYFVKLTITSTGGCVSVLQKKVSIQGPTGTFSYAPLSGCIPLKIDFSAVTQNTLSIVWDFNDGTTVDTIGTAISHIYTHQGSYLPKVILSDAKGCHVAIPGIDTINVYSATARFNFLNHALCDSGSISFRDSSSSNDIIAGYSWDFGDGDSSSLKNPTHQYAATGIYYPKLTVTTKIGCMSTKTTASPVKIVASPQVDFITTGNGCTPLNATFNGKLLVADTSAITWIWDFGNSSTSTLQNPLQQTYSKSGVYTVKLKILNSTGCSDTASKAIEAYKIPAVDAGANITICQGRGNNLTATGADTYAWSPSLGLSCVNCASPVATPAVETKYYLLGTTIYGCTAQDSVDVKVKYPFVMSYSAGDTLCKGSSTRLSASGANSYVWAPTAGLNNATIANPVATPDITTTYKVIGTDDLGCFKDTGSITIKVYPIPTVDAGPDQTINVGKTIDLVPVISSDVTNVTWSPTGSISRNFYPGITIKPTQTTEYTVDVKNAGGCEARDAVTVYVVCDGANVFIPNTFSPNGDGANDIFYPRGTGLFKVKTLRIFNRWGEVVFEKQDFMPNNPSYGWDGTYKGIKLTSDVYVYTIDIVCDNTSVLTFNGNVALIK